MSEVALQATAAFPEGWASGNYVPLEDVSKHVVGRVIRGIEFVRDDIIRIVLDDGSFVVFEPSGIEGDQLDLRIEK